MRLARRGRRILVGVITVLSEHLLRASAARHARSAGPAHQPIFIVGAPRTGSTILYQALTNRYHVLFVDNLACLFNRHLFLGLWLSRIAFRDRPHHNFSSTHGDTPGWHAPSECGEFWYRWFPRSRHFATEGDLQPRHVDELRREVYGAAHALESPLLFKNLNAGQRIDALKACFPDARYIFIRRRSEEVVASILRARGELGVPDGVWWSIKPERYEEYLSLPSEVMVARQVEDIEARIEADLAALPAARHRTVWHHELGEDKVEELARWLDLRPRESGCLPPFRASDGPGGQG